MSMEFSRHKCCCGLPFTSPGNLSDPGIEPGSPALQVGSLPLEPPGKPHLSETTSINILVNFLVVVCVREREREIEKWRETERWKDRQSQREK